MREFLEQWIGKWGSKMEGMMGINTETSRQSRPDNRISRALLPSSEAHVWKSREGRGDAFKAGLKKGRLKTQE